MNKLLTSFQAKKKDPAHPKAGEARQGETKSER